VPSELGRDGCGRPPAGSSTRFALCGRRATRTGLRRVRSGRILTLRIRKWTRWWPDKVPTPCSSCRSDTATRVVTVKVPTTHRDHRGVLLKSARDRIDITSAYQQVGSYRGAPNCAAPPTRPSNGSWRSSRPPGRRHLGLSGPTITMRWPMWSPTESASPRVGSRRSGCCGSLALPAPTRFDVALSPRPKPDIITSGSLGHRYQNT
jgi:hypothetical protein